MSGHWIQLHDIRIRADWQGGERQDVCLISRALSALFNVPSQIFEWDDNDLLTMPFNVT